MWRRVFTSNRVWYVMLQSNCGSYWSQITLHLLPKCTKMVWHGSVTWYCKKSGETELLIGCCKFVCLTDVKYNEWNQARCSGTFYIDRQPGFTHCYTCEDFPRKYRYFCPLLNLMVTWFILYVKWRMRVFFLYCRQKEARTQSKCSTTEPSDSVPRHVSRNLSLSPCIFSWDFDNSFFECNQTSTVHCQTSWGRKRPKVWILYVWHHS